jgi:Anti-sigma factor NepR
MTGAFRKSGAEASGSSSLDDADERDDSADLSPLVVDAVGKALQAHFRSISDMPLPDRFLVLLAELEASERNHDA